MKTATRREDCDGAGGWAAQTELGKLGVGSLLNPSLEIKEKAGGWIWGGRLRLSLGVGVGSGTKASTLTGLGWGWQSARPASPFGYDWSGLSPAAQHPTL